MWQIILQSWNSSFTEGLLSLHSVTHVLSLVWRWCPRVGTQWVISYINMICAVQQQVASVSLVYFVPHDKQLWTVSSAVCCALDVSVSYDSALCPGWPGDHSDGAVSQSMPPSCLAVRCLRVISVNWCLYEITWASAGSSLTKSFCDVAIIHTSSPDMMDGVCGHSPHLSLTDTPC